MKAAASFYKGWLQPACPNHVRAKHRAAVHPGVNEQMPTRRRDGGFLASGGKQSHRVVQGNTGAK